MTAEGLNMERFLTELGKASVHIKRLRRINPRKVRMLVHECELPFIQSFASEKGWSVVVGQKCGLNRIWAAINRQWLLVIFLLLMGCGLVIVSQTACRVVVIDGGRYEQDILSFLCDEGIRLPCRKTAIDLNELRDALEWRYPELSRIECGWRGMTLRLCLVNGISEGETFTSNGSGNLVASRTGIVERITTYAGTPVVAPGDLVQRGQLLIKGEERSTNETTKPVRASGAVLARIWDGERVGISTQETETIYTGAEKERMVVSCPFFELWHPEQGAFEHEDVQRTKMTLGGIFIPVTVCREKHKEAQHVTRSRDLAEVRAEAGIAAMRALRRKIGFDDVLVDKWIEYSIIDDERIYALAVGMRVIDIAVPAEAYLP